MRDNRRARLILAMLLLTAFTLITLDYRSGGGGPLRSVAMGAGKCVEEFEALQQVLVADHRR